MRRTEAVLNVATQRRRLGRILRGTRSFLESEISWVLVDNIRGESNIMVIINLLPGLFSKYADVVLWWKVLTQKLFRLQQGRQDRHADVPGVHPQ